MKVIDFETVRGVLRLAEEINEQALKRDLEEVAAIPKASISRHERERLLVRKAISHLPQNSRLIVFLKFWEGDSLEEIAQTLNLSLESVRIEYVIALSYLEKVLRPYVLEPDFFTKGNLPAV